MGQGGWQVIARQRKGQGRWVLGFLCRDEGYHREGQDGLRGMKRERLREWQLGSFY